MYKEGTTDDGKKGAIYGGCKGYSKLLQSYNSVNNRTIYCSKESIVVISINCMCIKNNIFIIVV